MITIKTSISYMYLHILNYIFLFNFYFQYYLLCIIYINCLQFIYFYNNYFINNKSNNKNIKKN